MSFVQEDAPADSGVMPFANLAEQQKCPSFVLFCFLLVCLRDLLYKMVYRKAGESRWNAERQTNALLPPPHTQSLMSPRHQQEPRVL